MDATGAAAEADKTPVKRRSVWLPTSWGVISLLLAGLSLALLHTDWLWRWDQLLYDSQLKFWSRPAPDDILIVAIDTPSLSRIGRWPWNRHHHALLIERLTEAGAEQEQAQDGGALQRPGRIAIEVLVDETEVVQVEREVVQRHPDQREGAQGVERIEASGHRRPAYPCCPSAGRRRRCAVNQALAAPQQLTKAMPASDAPSGAWSKNTMPAITANPTWQYR